MTNDYENDDGKIVPIVGASSRPDERKPRSGMFADERNVRPKARDIHYYPDAQKDYYRELLIAYKRDERIGDQKLRNRIMAREDELLTQQTYEGTSNKPKKERDGRLSRDDIRKWLDETASHRIGDSKFWFVDRFINQEIPWDKRFALQRQVSEALQEYHISNLIALLPPAKKFGSSKIQQATIVDLNESVFSGFSEMKSSLNPIGAECVAIKINMRNRHIGTATILYFFPESMDDESGDQESENLDIACDQVVDFATGYFIVQGPKVTQTTIPPSDNPRAVEQKLAAMHQIDCGIIASSGRDVMPDVVFNHFAPDRITLAELAAISEFDEKSFSAQPERWNELRFTAGFEGPTADLRRVIPSKNTLKSFEKFSLGYEYA